MIILYKLLINQLYNLYMNRLNLKQNQIRKNKLLINQLYNLYMNRLNLKQNQIRKNKLLIRIIQIPQNLLIYKILIKQKQKKNNYKQTNNWTNNQIVYQMINQINN